jgi:hypothetical protein
VAVVGNINCTIEKMKKGYYLGSGQLYDVKRELLWILYDLEHMKRFPFGLLELGDCEEHRGSPRSSEWITVADLDEPILVNEKLFRDAIQINHDNYNEAQVYPYYCTRVNNLLEDFIACRSQICILHFNPTDAGHYHKDAGKMSPDQEYRFVEALKMYAQAARVTSKYPYESGTIQLNKHVSAAALLIFEDILTTTNGDDDKRNPREWQTMVNAIDSCVWLLVFFDSLLFWEQQQQQFKGNSHQHFVEALKPSHPHSMSKSVACFSQKVRIEAMQRLYSPEPTNFETSHTVYHPTLRSKRMNSDSLLTVAIKKPKVAIREMDLSMIFAGEDDDVGGGRRSKRARRR